MAQRDGTGTAGGVRPGTSRDALVVLVISVVLTAVGLALSRVDFFPIAAAREARLIDESFRELFVLSVPVVAVVLAVMGYALFRFRAPGPLPTDAPPAVGEPVRGISITWLGVTTGLALVSIVLGLRILDELGWYSPPRPDLVVQVRAEQWNWTFTYPQYGVTVNKAQDLILPVGRRVRFDITSTDVIHSFWIPAFRMKLDAVPGLTTSYEVTPDRVGSNDADGSIYRIQCAEICGTGHTRMATTLTIVSDAEFERRLQQLRSRALAPGGP